MAISIDDRTAVSDTVQLYIDGARDGDVSKLRQAFHADARMFGSLGGQRFDVPIGVLQSAGVEEEGYWGSVSFTDFFTLSRFGDEWKIVNKTFAHTGGEPPAM